MMVPSVQKVRLFCLVFGITVGLFLTIIFRAPNDLDCSGQIINRGATYIKSTDENEPPQKEFRFSEEKSSVFNFSIAKKLYKKVRILCWILTSPKTLRTKGKAVKETWGKRCNKIIFMSSEDVPSYPSINLGVPEGRENLWGKTRAAFKYIYQNHLNDADWFLKADDDSFVVVENLRHLLSKYSPDDPHFFGRWFVPFGGYNSGGAGYVLSKKSVRLFMKAMNNPWKCPEKYFAEDVAIGNCLALYDVHPEDTRDEHGRQTFHPYAIEYHFIPGYIGQNDWLHSYDKYPVQIGPNCCSDHSITFHYVNIQNMYVYDYFIQTLHPHGITHVPHS
eukprot:Seg1058.21 transcript_id=Seg1058.21/GoldUCD/mRNA.D3Y31 product="Glycoprotein-N-acetylgalactosamine 3-beta-galactosyltransferase 1" protein_id=Seg1058.21/GoldUCD/D3Y31